MAPYPEYGPLNLHDDGDLVVGLTRAIQLAHHHADVNLRKAPAREVFGALSLTWEQTEDPTLERRRAMILDLYHAMHDEISATRSGAL